MQTAQYWKPGETKPRGGDRGDGGGSGSGRSNKDSRRGEKRGSTTGDGGRGNDSDLRSRKEGSDGSAKKKGKKGQGKGKQDSRSGSGIRAEVSRAAAKAPVAGPSQGLLAMKVGVRTPKAAGRLPRAVSCGEERPPVAREQSKVVCWGFSQSAFAFFVWVESESSTLVLDRCRTRFLKGVPPYRGGII